MSEIDDLRRVVGANAPEKPRNAPHAEDHGAYGIAVLSSTGVVNPGETLTFDVFVSGYGEIEGSKLVFYPPQAIVGEGSFYRFGLEPPEGENPGCFGAEKRDLGPHGATIDFCGGPKLANWERPSMYLDESWSGELPPISMEKMSIPTGCGPVHVELITRPDSRPGTYSVQFLFTYFNGSVWANSSETVQFSVRSYYQRNEWWIWPVGLAAAGIAVLLGIKELCSWLAQLVW